MKRILVLRFSSIGDIVLTTPVIRALKVQTGAHVTYLTKSSFKAILEPNPHIDEVVSFKDEVTEVMEELKNRDFDHIVDLHKNIRSRRVIMALKKPSSSFPKLNVEKYLLTRFKINRMPERHIVDRYFEAVQDLGVKHDSGGLEYYLPEGMNQNWRSWLPETHQSGFLGFVIGGQHATKMLPESRILEVCNMANQNIVLLGGPEDQEKGERIANQAGKKVFNGAGKFKLYESALLVREAQAILTHDTGLMHIAAAFQKQIISIWGNTVSDFGMYPYKPGRGSKQIEVKGLNCRPCSKIGHDQCPKGHFKCMNLISLDEVISALPVS